MERKKIHGQSTACQREKCCQASRVSEVRSHMPQLDSLRALAILGVAYHHWLPASWRMGLPTEAGLFFFFVLSGFLMTRGLLHERDRMTIGSILKKFHIKRLKRIYPAYYAALAIAALCGREAILHHPLYWLTNTQNFLIQKLDYWPDSVSHFWTLAIEQQYYIFWPLVILLCPKRWMTTALLLLVCISPLSRYLIEEGQASCINLNPLKMIDDFAIGSLLALWMRRGMTLPNRWTDLAGILALCGYAFFYCLWQLNLPSHGGGYFQQTLLAVAFASLIARAATGRTGILARLLDSPLLVKIGHMSYGIYLFHNLAPLFAGKIFWFLWHPQLDANLAIILRIPCYLLITWALTLLCERFIEKKFNS